MALGRFRPARLGFVPEGSPAARRALREDGGVVIRW
jgi:hypothetical protein